MSLSPPQSVAMGKSPHGWIPKNNVAMSACCTWFGLGAAATHPTAPWLFGLIRPCVFCCLSLGLGNVESSLSPCFTQFGWSVKGGNLRPMSVWSNMTYVFEIKATTDSTKKYILMLLGHWISKECQEAPEQEPRRRNLIVNSPFTVSNGQTTFATSSSY